jgi:hypothetical protein
MSRQFQFRLRCAYCATTLLLAIWITNSVLVAELGGVPHLYGWPLLVLRPEGFDQPRAWVWAVDFLGACVLLGSTWAVGIRICRAQARGMRFRLATLLGVVAATAAVAAVWRWSADHLLFEVAQFGDQGDDLLGTSAVLDLTAFMAYLPHWARPAQVIVRIGVLAGLGCTAYVVGRALVALAGGLLAPRGSATVDTLIT